MKEIYSVDERLGIRYFSLLYERGLASPNDTLGYHGTTLEAINYIFKHGVLPGSPGQSDNDRPTQQPGDLFFFPNSVHFPNHTRRDKFSAEPIYDAGRYAYNLGKAHRFLDLLQLEIADQNNIKIAYALTHPLIVSPESSHPLFTYLSTDVRQEAEEAITLLTERYNISHLDITQAMKISSKRKGIILGLSSDARFAYSIADGDKGEGDLRLVTENGLHPIYINGIFAEGEEKAFFESLQRIPS